jgi:predicted GNAT family acetyltransferase
VEQAILFTGKQNVPAQRAYEALGFRPIGDYRILILRDPIAPPV